MQSAEDEDGGRGRGNFDGSSNPAFVSDDDKSGAAESNGDLAIPKPKVNPFSIQECTTNAHDILYHFGFSI